MGLLFRVQDSGVSSSVFGEEVDYSELKLGVWVLREYSSTCISPGFLSDDTCKKYYLTVIVTRTIIVKLVTP